MARFLCNVEERIFGNFLVEAKTQEEAQKIAEEILDLVDTILEIPNIELEDDKEIEFSVE